MHVAWMEKLVQENITDHTSSASVVIKGNQVKEPPMNPQIQNVIFIPIMHDTLHDVIVILRVVWSGPAGTYVIHLSVTSVFLCQRTPFVMLSIKYRLYTRIIMM